MREALRIWLLLLASSTRHAYCGDANVSGASNSTASSVESANAKHTSISAVASVATPSGYATCSSRTANYITHTLPQQCLRTDRVTGSASHSGTDDKAERSDAPTQGTGPSTSTSLSSTEVSVTLSTAPEGARSSGESASEHPATLSSSPPATATDTENDSPLDNANFLSFEEWRKQNLAKSGQSPENVGQGRNVEGVRERPGINNALESFGEEGEIDLDFTGFGSGAKAPKASSKQSRTEMATEVPSGELAPALRSRDAGKTCKERTNYASFDCAATVLKSNSECKSASSVLVENKDNYMLNTCSAKNKFFIVELCDDILIDTIVLANYEFFSSIFRHFRVSVSDRYPVKIEKWKDLGTFEARNAREVQAFLIDRPQIWARYLRIEFLSHYGSEYYCPVSLLRVHGTTMLEDYRHQEEVARGENVEEEAASEIEVDAVPVVAQEPASSTDESEKATVTAIQNVEMGESRRVADSVSMTEPDNTTATTQTVAVPTEPVLTSPNSNTTSDLFGKHVLSSDALTCASDIDSALEYNTSSTARGSRATGSNATVGPDLAVRSSATERSSSSTTMSSLPTNSSASGGSSALRSDVGSDTHEASTRSSGAAPISEQANGTDGNSGSVSNTTSTAPSSSMSTSTEVTTSALPHTSSASTSESSRHTATPSISSQQQPATQESFFKSVNKRLQQLESNSTLSLQYIEEQSRILRDAFSKVEKRQIAATTSFLTDLNSTVMTELNGFRQAYDQLWQSTVIELEGQREQYQRDMLAMSTRLTLVADELVWQKRMGIVQSTLLLLCLGLVLFARQGNAYLEVPLMQQMLNRSQAALRAGWESPPASPSPNSRSPVALFRRKLWRSHTQPVNGSVTDATDSRPESKEGLEVHVAPPTPPSVVGSESLGDEDEFEDVWEARSGPATPLGTREGSYDGVEWEDPGAFGSVES